MPTRKLYAGMNEYLTFIDDINKKYIHNNGVILGSIGTVKLNHTLSNIPLSIKPHNFPHLNTIDNVKLRLHASSNARYTFVFFARILADIKF